ncbi:MAG: methionyl-tRNA formyltransferase [Chitinispirillales bacterium]|jgi:methionyl-tRNA formyltransferase|nr:methionyl-tRNA formyltransferase [Chitinispirillales bacterium]
MKIVFMGSAEFGLPALGELLARHSVAAVVSAPAKPKGRGLKVVDTPIADYVKKGGVSAPLLTPDDVAAPQFIKELTAFDADLFVVVAFRILPKSVFSIPKFGTLNVHASLLPRYRGAAPIHRAIEAGEAETGVTVFRIDEGVDTGEIITQKRTPIGAQETTPELYKRLSDMGAAALLEAIDTLESGTAASVKQNNAEATPAPKLSKEEGRVDWRLPVEDVFNKMRAHIPFPGSYFFLNGKRVNIEWGVASGGGGTNPPPPPGTILIAENDYIDVQCGTGALRITKVKPEGKQTMDVHSFLLGHEVIEGTVLE